MAALPLAEHFVAARIGFGLRSRCSFSAQCSSLWTSGSRCGIWKAQEGKTQSGEIGTLSRCSNHSAFSSPRWLFRQRHELVVENLLVRHQLQVALRSRPHPTKTRDRFFWLVVRRLFPDWRRHLMLVRPETLLRWHRQGWRLYWPWRSGRHLGQPRFSPEIRELIATMKRRT